MATRFGTQPTRATNSTTASSRQRAWSEAAERLGSRPMGSDTRVEDFVHLISRYAGIAALATAIVAGGQLLLF
jgi:hypothetical protein